MNACALFGHKLCLENVGLMLFSRYQGTAYSLYTEEDGSDKAKQLIQVLEEADQEVPEDLVTISKMRKPSKSKKGRSQSLPRRGGSTYGYDEDDFADAYYQNRGRSRRDSGYQGRRLGSLDRY